MRKALAAFIQKRELIRRRKVRKLDRPWTKDPILAQYRFCNVRREDDKVTRWLKKNWREPHNKHVNLTVAMVLARLINWPPTLEAIGFPLWWDSEYKSRVLTVIRDRMGNGKKAWSSAYVVTTCGKKMPKENYILSLCQQVVDNDVKPEKDDTLKTFWERLRMVDGLGAGFLAAQVVADLKNTRDNPLNEAEDWYNWAVPGPGSRRGVNRYYQQPLNKKLPDYAWLESMQRIRKSVEPLLPSYLRDSMCLQDWQNCMCEFDKYLRAKNGEGRPRQNYKPG